MNRKNTNIAILLAIIVIAVFVTLGFFGLNSFMVTPSVPLSEDVLKEIQDTGTVSELHVVDVVEGTGDPVAAGDTVAVHYTGLLPDGTIFDASQDHGGPISFTVGAGVVIQGWERGLIGMKEGGRRILVIPPSLGYGATGVGPIPPNATLIFDLELAQRTPAEEPAE